MKLGCHISISKGFAKAAQQAVDLGAASFQVFSKNPRSLRGKKLDLDDAAKGRHICQENGLLLITHTPYITNLSSPKDDLHEVTIRSLREDLQISHAFGAVGAVVHCGKHVGEGEAFGVQRMVDTLNQILEGYEKDTFLLLENTAGQGSELGMQMETLVAIREQVENPRRLAFCFDTCHAFAAGIWEEESVEAFFQMARQTGYLPHLKAIHLNDSKAPYKSNKDRHEKIGKGEIGAKALALFLTEALQNLDPDTLPVVLETPVEDEREYADEMVYVRELLA